MAVSLEEARKIFRTANPIPSVPDELLRERWMSFVETMIHEIESFWIEEDHPRLETECMRGL